MRNNLIIPVDTWVLVSMGDDELNLLRKFAGISDGFAETFGKGLSSENGIGNIYAYDNVKLASDEEIEKYRDTFTEGIY